MFDGARVNGLFGGTECVMCVGVLAMHNESAATIALPLNVVVLASCLQRARRCVVIELQG